MRWGSGSDALLCRMSLPRQDAQHDVVFLHAAMMAVATSPGQGEAHIDVKSGRAVRRHPVAMCAGMHRLRPFRSLARRMSRSMGPSTSASRSLCRRFIEPETGRARWPRRTLMPLQKATSSLIAFFTRSQARRH